MRRLTAVTVAQDYEARQHRDNRLYSEPTPGAVQLGWVYVRGTSVQRKTGQQPLQRLGLLATGHCLRGHRLSR